MFQRVVLIGIVAILLGLSTAPAHAAGERRMYITAALGVAERYWAGREDGVHRCAAIVSTRIVPARRIDGLAGDAILDGCRIGFPRMRLSSALFDQRFGAFRWAVICHTYSHEFGHALGRRHSARGLMAESPDPAYVVGFARRHCGNDPLTGEPIPELHPKHLMRAFDAPRRRRG